jgi:hypothetical protein
MPPKFEVMVKRSLRGDIRNQDTNGWRHITITSLSGCLPSVRAKTLIRLRRESYEMKYDLAIKVAAIASAITFGPDRWAALGFDIGSISLARVLGGTLGGAAFGIIPLAIPSFFEIKESGGA